MKKHEFRQETEAVRGRAGLAKKNGPLATPIYQTSTFEVTDNQEQVRATSTDSFYTRYGNPTHTVAENAIAELEGTDARVAVLIGHGRDHHFDSFAGEGGRPHRGAARYLWRRDQISRRSGCRSLGLRRHSSTPTTSSSTNARSGPTQSYLHLESPTNPTVRIVDFERIAALASKHIVITMWIRLLPRPSIAVRRSGASIWCCIRGQNILVDIPI